MLKKLFIFDLDGTLVDTGKDIALSVNHMRRSLGYPELELRAIYRMVGRGLHQLISDCLETQDRKLIEKGGKIYRSFYHEHMLDHSRVYEGAVACLDSLKSRTLAVVTNKPNPYADEMLKTLKVAHYFAQIVPGNSAYPQKPDPAAVLALMKQYHASPDETVMIGDSLIDLEMGRNAGVHCVLFTHGLTEEPVLRAAKPDHLFHSYAEFSKFLKQENW